MWLRMYGQNKEVFFPERESLFSDGGRGNSLKSTKKSLKTTLNKTKNRQKNNKTLSNKILITTKKFLKHL